MPTVVGREAINRARQLRRGMTEGERRLRRELKEFRRLYGIHVRRQVPIGPYIADFAVHSAKLVIEVDGHFHAEPHRIGADAVRDRWLYQAGYKVLRLRTGDLDDAFDGCIEEILRELGLMH
jgi:very-short-patch-repair endonuclease